MADSISPLWAPGRHNYKEAMQTIVLPPVLQFPLFHHFGHSLLSLHFLVVNAGVWSTPDLELAAELLIKEINRLPQLNLKWNFWRVQ